MGMSAHGCIDAAGPAHAAVAANYLFIERLAHAMQALELIRHARVFGRGQVVDAGQS